MWLNIESGLWSRLIGLWGFLSWKNCVLTFFKRGGKKEEEKKSSIKWEHIQNTMVEKSMQKNMSEHTYAN